MEKKDLLANYAASKQNMCITNDTISDRLFQEYGVNRGLRDVNGKGVLTGLTRISKIVSFKDENGKQVPCDGELWYRGYNVKTLIKSIGPNEFGFERCQGMQRTAAEFPLAVKALDFKEAPAGEQVEFS